MLCSTQHLTDSDGCLEDQFQHKIWKTLARKENNCSGHSCWKIQKRNETGKMQIARRPAGSHYENHSIGCYIEMRQKESAYILLVQMSPMALKVQGNGDVNVSYCIIIFYNT